VEYLGIIYRPANSLWTPLNLGVSQIGPLLQNSKMSAQFLGFYRFLLSFIRNLFPASLAPQRSHQENPPWQWGEPETRCPLIAEQTLPRCPILIQPISPPLSASNATPRNTLCGAVLSQHGPDGLWHPLPSCLNRSLKPNRTMIFINRELLVSSKALCEWRHYLEGSPHSLRNPFRS